MTKDAAELGASDLEAVRGGLGKSPAECGAQYHKDLKVVDLMVNDRPASAPANYDAHVKEVKDGIERERRSCMYRSTLG